MKNIALYILLFIIGSCAKSNDDLKLKIDTEQINFVSKDETNNFFSYKNDSATTNAKNVLTFSITNSTDKKLLFVFDIEKIYPSISKERDAFGYLGFLIKDKNDGILKFSSPLVTFKESDVKNNIAEYSKYQDSIKKNHYKAMDIDENHLEIINYLDNSIIVYPNETKTFKTILSFPVLKEIGNDYTTYPLYYKDLKNGQQFQLFYSCDGKALNKILPEYIKSELDSNKIEIFDGILMSNSIPLKIKL